MAEHKPGFVYSFSESLNQKIAISLKTGKLYTFDGVQYSPAEVAALQKNSKDIPLEVHILKKTFDGTITEGEK